MCRDKDEFVGVGSVTWDGNDFIHPNCLSIRRGHPFVGWEKIMTIPGNKIPVHTAYPCHFVR
ncbi:MAG: hypothetical protein GX599_04545 [Chloroflexi bacterium]|nr:hypothetical protein [Chloroflexota bacterium]